MEVGQISEFIKLGFKFKSRGCLSFSITRVVSSFGLDFSATTEHPSRYRSAARISAVAAVYVVAASVVVGVFCSSNLERRSKQQPPTLTLTLTFQFFLCFFLQVLRSSIPLFFRCSIFHFDSSQLFHFCNVLLFLSQLLMG